MPGTSHPEVHDTPYAVLIKDKGDRPDQDCCLQIHGNICMRAIVVTQSLDWRLHGFDLLSEHQPATGFEWPLMAATWMVGAQYKPAEVRRMRAGLLATHLRSIFLQCYRMQLMPSCW